MICKECGTEFEANRSWQKFCSTQCRMDYHNKNKKVIKVGELDNDTRQTLLEFLDRAEKDPTMWDKLQRKLEGMNGNELSVS